MSINANETIVYDEAGLRAAVQTDNGIDYVFLADDITLLSGITIHPDKSGLVIDGEYPAGVQHAFTDMNSMFDADTIGVRASSQITLTFKNMTINGHNYFGVPFIRANTPGVDTSGVTVVYENISYTGPQLTYNHNGLTRYIDCNIEIFQTGICAAQEVGEVKKIEFGGRTTILHRTTDDLYSVFWFRDWDSDSSLTLLEDAELEVVSENNYFMFNRDGLLGVPTYLVPVEYTLRAGSRFSLSVNKAVCYSSAHQINAFTLEQGAEFRYIQATNNGTAASMYVNGPLTVGEDSQFYMQAASATQPIVSFTSDANCLLTVDNPRSFVLYNPNLRALTAPVETAYQISAGQLNIWTVATQPPESAGGFDDEPRYPWKKKDFETLFEAQGTFSESMTQVTWNLEQEDEPYPAMTFFHLESARVLSIGDWPVSVNPVKDDGSNIVGWTVPEAKMKLEYTDGGIAHEIEVSADSDGRFLISTALEMPPEISAGTVLTLWSNIPFLIKYIKATVIQAGELEIISAPEEMVFVPSPISTNPILLPRDELTEPVVVEDLQSVPTQWELLASITGPLQTADGHILPDAVVYVEAAGAQPQVLNTVPKVVYTGGPTAGQTDVEWPEGEGILARISVPMHWGTRYSTQIIWDLRII